MGVALVIPAAGSGSRFGGPIPKHYLPLAGRPVLAWTLQAFAGLVDEALLAVDDTWHDQASALAATAPFPCQVVRGGNTRQASVAAALAAVSPAHDRVLIHDAVRPLVPRACIIACIEALADHPAAVVAVPCAATVKRAGPNHQVLATVPRDDLWLAQTPQGVRRHEGLRAFAALAGDTSCTDDAQVMERAGYAVAIVRGDARNLKITTPDDFAVAEALLIH